MKRDSLIVTQSNNQHIPVEEIEPVILKFAKWKQEAGQPITPTEGLQFANSLIDGKPLQDELKVYQPSQGKQPTGLLSIRYWQQFIKGNRHVLESAKGYRVAANRTEWVTYQNIECMYNLVCEQMIDAGLARRLSEEEQYWVDENGEQVECEKDSVGKKVNIEITHPEWIIFGDEIGTNISQNMLVDRSLLWRKEVGQM